MLEAAVNSTTRLFCISILPPGNTRHGLYVNKRLRDRLPDSRILIGLWGEPAEDERGRLARFQRVRQDGVFTSLQEMVKVVVASAPVVEPPPAEPAPEAPAGAAAPVPA